MNKPLLALLAGAFILIAFAGSAPEAQAHCQIPCGIYDDHARIHRLLEDVKTIAKADREITELAQKRDAQSLNQATRWIDVKDEHAAHIIEVVSEYFLTQKIKVADPKDKAAWQAYTAKLVAHHKVMRLAMKAKQTVDEAVASRLEAAVSALEVYWPVAHH